MNTQVPFTCNTMQTFQGLYMTTKMSQHPRQGQTAQKAEHYRSLWDIQPATTSGKSPFSAANYPLKAVYFKD